MSDLKKPTPEQTPNKKYHSNASQIDTHIHGTEHPFPKSRPLIISPEEGRPPPGGGGPLTIWWWHVLRFVAKFEWLCALPLCHRQLPVIFVIGNRQWFMSTATTVIFCRAFSVILFNLPQVSELLGTSCGKWSCNQSKSTALQCRCWANHKTSWWSQWRRKRKHW